MDKGVSHFLGPWVLQQSRFLRISRAYLATLANVQPAKARCSWCLWCTTAWSAQSAWTAGNSGNRVCPLLWGMLMPHPPKKISDHSSRSSWSRTTMSPSNRQGLPLELSRQRRECHLGRGKPQPESPTAWWFEQPCKGNQGSVPGFCWFQVRPLPAVHPSGP